MAKKAKNEPVVVVTACPGCKKRCCGNLAVLQQQLKQERKKRRKLEKRLKAKKARRKAAPV
ncbi:MAG: hypothetical protein JXN59_11485 [Anaerolineae bacterium]|nr:hypothetical protein [Anaerolineae bacterium]